MTVHGRMWEDDWGYALPLSPSHSPPPSHTHRFERLLEQHGLQAGIQGLPYALQQHRPAILQGGQVRVRG